MKNYEKVHVDKEPRTELHDKLNFTGAEISVNNLPAGAGIPFVHAHKNNEEIYIILSGNGTMTVDEETFDLSPLDFVRVSPAGKRQIKASENEPLEYICIQTKENSLGGYTQDDAIMIE